MKSTMYKALFYASRMKVIVDSTYYLHASRFTLEIRSFLSQESLEISFRYGLSFYSILTNLMDSHLVEHLKASFAKTVSHMRN